MNGFLTKKQVLKTCFLFLVLCLLTAFPSIASTPPADGDYSVPVALTGGTGKASIRSPAGISVKKGEITATVVWSSSHYDRMTVDGQDYNPVSTDGGSTFVIPVRLNEKMTVMAETLAMSQPHEIEYILYFDGSGITQDPFRRFGIPAAIAATALIGIVVGIGIFRPGRKSVS